MLILTPALRDHLEAVNAEVNALPYLSDPERWGVEELWGEADDLGGDCEDFSIAKRNRLLALGFPAKPLRLATCQTETGEGHAVLTVDTDQGTLVLDNRFPAVLPFERLTALGYRWISRQAADGGRGWVKIAA